MRVFKQRKLRRRALVALAGAILLADAAYLAWIAASQSAAHPVVVELSVSTHDTDFIKVPGQKAVRLTSNGWRSTEGRIVTDLAAFGRAEAERWDQEYPYFPLFVELGDQPTFGHFVTSVKRLQALRVCRIVMRESGFVEMLPSGKRIETIPLLKICPSAWQVTRPK